MYAAAMASNNGQKTITMTAFVQNEGVPVAAREELAVGDGQQFMQVDFSSLLMNSNRVVIGCRAADGHIDVREIHADRDVLHTVSSVMRRALAGFYIPAWGMSATDRYNTLPETGQRFSFVADHNPMDDFCGNAEIRALFARGTPVRTR